MRPPNPGCFGVQAGLAPVAPAKPHQSRVHLSGRLVTQPQTLHRAGSEVLDDHVGPGHRPQSELDTAIRFQVNSNRALGIVAEGKGAGAILPRLLVCARRILGAKAFGASPRLLVHYRSPVAGHVLVPPPSWRKPRTPPLSPPVSYTHLT